MKIDSFKIQMKGGSYLISLNQLKKLNFQKKLSKNYESILHLL